MPACTQPSELLGRVSLPPKQAPSDRSTTHPPTLFYSPPPLSSSLFCIGLGLVWAGICKPPSPAHLQVCLDVLVVQLRLGEDVGLDLQGGRAGGRAGGREGGRVGGWEDGRVGGGEGGRVGVWGACG